MSLPTLCRILTVSPGELPQGHTFVIVCPHDGGVPVVFTSPDERDQLVARAAFLQWDRQRSAVAEPVREVAGVAGDAEEATQPR